MSTHLAELRGVSVQYGNRRVLHNINLRVEPGDFWTLIGPNGAGKSTLLGLFNGLTPYSDGAIFFGSSGFSVGNPCQELAG